MIQPHSFTVPLQISVSLGTQPIAAQPPVPARLGELAQGELFAEALSNVFEQAAGRFDLTALTSHQFGWQSALNSVLCSYAAYSNAAENKAIVRDRWRFETCRFIATADTECFVASTADAVVVSFRGTQQVADWLINLNAAWTNVSYGAVHRGFYFAFQSVKSQLEAALAEAHADRKKVKITGHSLGGALATIAAAEWFSHYPIVGIYTFGQPAVGFSAFRSYLDVRYRDSFYRFVNEDDIVTRVPPGYRHVGKLYHFTTGGLTHEATARATLADDTPTMSEPEFLQLKAQLQAAKTIAPIAMNETLQRNLVQEGFFPSVADHSLDGYIQKIVRKLS